MTQIIDIIAGLRDLAANGSKSEQRLAHRILADPGATVHAPISDLAASVAVSEPTVTRFARALGCDGTRDFKVKLAQAVALGGNYMSAAPADRGLERDRALHIITDAAHSAIDRYVQGLDPAVLGHISREILRADRIAIAGSGGTSSMIAMELQNRLFRFGLPAVAQVDGQLQRMQAALSTPQSVHIAFSVSGRARSVIDATVAARQYGAATVAFTAAGSPLARAAETTITLPPVEDSLLLKPTSSRFGLLAMIDVLALLVGMGVGPAATEGLRRMKQVLGNMGPGDPMMPVGD